jgi:hypothetical protein
MKISANLSHNRAELRTRSGGWRWPSQTPAVRVRPGAKDAAHGDTGWNHPRKDGVRPIGMACTGLFPRVPQQAAVAGHLCPTQITQPAKVCWIGAGRAHVKDGARAWIVY